MNKLVAAAAALVLAPCGHTQGGEPAPEPSMEPPPLAVEPETGLRYRVGRVEDCGFVSVVLATKVGFEHDPADATGLAASAAATLRVYFEDEARREHGFRVSQVGRGTLIDATVRTTELDTVIEELAAILTGPGLSDDVIERGIARAKLRADDELEVLPGRMLYWRAKQRLLGDDSRGRLGAGVPAVIDTLSTADVRSRIDTMFDGERSFLIAVGDTTEDAVCAAIVEHVSLDAEPAAAFDLVAAKVGELPAASTVHARVDAPFVSAAFRAKRWGEPGYVPFTIGMVVLRNRAHRSLAAPRGGEVRAEFPPVSFEYLDDTGVVMINRRGRDGDDVERVRREIAGVLADIREHGIHLGELTPALHELRRWLALPPYTDLAKQEMRRVPHNAMAARSHVLALYEILGLPEHLTVFCDRTPVRAVSRALLEAIDEGGIEWLSVVPE